MLNSLRRYRSLSLRISNYSAIGAGVVPALQTALRNVADHAGAGFVPVPISRVPGEADLDSIRLLVGDVDASGVDGIAGPDAVMKMLHRCRVVVTGTYHAAVFALANGVPAVGLVGSRYYEDKFRGLSTLFGDGCETVMIDEPDLAGRVERAVERQLARAEELRPSILKEAEREIGLGRAAFARLADAAEARARSHVPGRSTERPAA